MQLASVGEISFLSDLHHSAVIVKQKHLGATTSNNKQTTGGHRVGILSTEACKNHTELQSASGINISTRTVNRQLRKHVSTVEHLYTRLSELQWCEASKLKSGAVFSGLLNHTSLPSSLMDRSGFGGHQENATSWNIWCSSKRWWRNITSWGCGLMVSFGKVSICSSVALHLCTELVP